MARNIPFSSPQHDPGRRRVLQFGGLAVALPAAPALPAGVLAAQQAAETLGYSGPGYYLYPAWGDPVLYRVSAQSSSSTAEALLAFHDPHSNRLLWTQSLQGEAQFAGKLDE